MTPSRQASVAAAAVASVAAVACAWRLDEPAALVFDELFYVADAAALLETGAETAFAAHPILGKLLFAWSSLMFGDGPAGYRAVSVVAVFSSILFAARTAWWLSRSLPGVISTAVLVAAEGTVLATGRLALLDILVAPFLSASVLVVVRRMAQGLPVERGHAVLAGGLVGAACAVKWVALVPVAVVAAAVGATVVGVDGRNGEALRRALLVVVAASGVYVGAHASWWVSWSSNPRCGTGCDTSLVAATEAFVDHQGSLVAFHRDLAVTNRYAGPPWRWLIEPAVLFDDGDRSVVARPSWVLWGATVAALVGAGFSRVRRRLPKGWLLPVAVLWGALVPWFTLGRDGYSFYLAAVVPLAATAAATSAAVRSSAAPSILAAVAMVEAALRVW